ncbi:M24 family metallopeptidase [Caldivirga maquilingensis]|uniref:Peptidase M24 n=1 Tax=Caldivirga maquilingensis (strain ATCC 700844 / DSM 13496 / JCM 10307 / IC-167) TaxID=397948 RepID=A8M9V7_CALMQ|nr:Xaa-Pro peptidase family protein [Caldivirga maquilingensis]ABW02428.1 peptidase M24 [Caldivirga maquilingensis IC-167]
MGVGRFANRLRAFMNNARGLGVELAVVSTPVNIRYLTGARIETFERFGALLICLRNGESTLIIPKLDEGKVKELDLNYLTYTDSEGPRALVERVTSNCGNATVVGFESNAPLRHFWLLRSVLGGFKDLPIDDALVSLRIMKDEEEISNIKAAVKAIEKGFEAVENSLRAGLTEVKLAEVIRDVISSAGAEPRDILVQSGPNSAIPHWLPSSRRISDNDVVVIDLTATYNDYYGDLTRTFTVGNVNDEFIKIYNLVKRAHDEAITAVKDGVTGSYIDSVARRIIREGGYGEYFIHRTGHGIGLEVHEEPYISSDYVKALPRGSVFTIEPGIYLQGRFGVRLESNVVINSNGVVEVLDSYWPSINHAD